MQLQHLPYLLNPGLRQLVLTHPGTRRCLCFCSPDQALAFGWYLCKSPEGHLQNSRARNPAPGGVTAHAARTTRHSSGQRDRYRWVFL
jgi:hypothetical protein